MSEYRLIPFGAAFLQLTPTEYDTIMGRGLVAASITAPTHPSMGAHTELVNVEVLSKQLSLPEGWLEAAAREGRIPSMKAGKHRRYDPTAVLAALAQNGGADSGTAR